MYSESENWLSRNPGTSPEETSGVASGLVASKRSITVVCDGGSRLGAVRGSIHFSVATYRLSWEP